MTADLLLTVLVFALGGLVHGALGLGFPLVATPLLALMTDVRSAMLLILIPSLSMNVASILSEGRPGRDVVRFWPLILWGAVGSLVGTRLLVVSDPGPFKLLLALVILVYLAVQRLGVRLGWVRRHPRLGMALFGTLGGFLAGTVNVMLPALVVFVLEFGLPVSSTVQLFNLCFLVGKATQGTVFATSGLFSREIVTTGVVLALTTLAALGLGQLIRRHINEQLYRSLLKGVLLVLSLLLLGQYLLS